MAIEGTTFSSEQAIPVTITLRNVSEQPLVLPLIAPLSQQTYLHLEMIHESGIPAFSLNPFSEPALATAVGTQVLQRGEALVFTDTLNPAGIGFLGYPPPGSAPELLSGIFRLSASYVVEPSALPQASDAALFRGPANSTAPAQFQVTQARAGFAPVLSHRLLAATVGVATLLAAAGRRRRKSIRKN